MNKKTFNFDSEAQETWLSNNVLLPKIHVKLHLCSFNFKSADFSVGIAGGAVADSEDKGGCRQIEFWFLPGNMEL